MTSSAAIDLSKIAAPNLIQDLDFEAIFNEMVADLQKDFPEWQPIESEITTKALQIAAYKLLAEVQARNEAAKQCMIAFATGANLDHLAANLLVSRLENETDDALRARAILAQDGFSTAGPQAAYIYHAKSASPEIKDIRVLSPAPKEVEIIIMGNNPLIPTQETIDLVFAKCNSETVRPITDFVTAQAVEVIDFEITAVLTIYSGPDSELVLNAANAALQSHLQNIKKIGHDVTVSMITASLGVQGVQKVAIIAPAADIIISDYEVANCTNISITTGGIGE